MLVFLISFSQLLDTVTAHVYGHEMVQFLCLYASVQADFKMSLPILKPNLCR